MITGLYYLVRRICKFHAQCMDREVCAAFEMISRWKCVLVSTARRENTPPWAGRSGMPHVRPLEVASPTKPALGGHTRRHGRGVVVECARTFRRTRRGAAQAAAGRTPARTRAVWPAARSAVGSTQAAGAHSAVLHGGESLKIFLSSKSPGRSLRQSPCNCV